MLLTHLRLWRLVLAGLRYAHMLPGRFVSLPFPVLLTPSPLPDILTPFSLTRLDVILVSYLYGLCASLYLYFPDLYK